MKIAFLYVSKWLGLFALAKYITRGGLKILCYHAFANYKDEAQWQNLFMRVETFQRRLDYLERSRFVVLDLEKALDLMDQEALPDNVVVITIDDGWYSTKTCAHPILKRYSYPYTVYLTSYYYSNNIPVIDLAIPYLFWKTEKSHLDLDQLDISMSGVVDLSNTDVCSEVAKKIVRYGHTKLDNQGRYALAERIGKILEVDFCEIDESRVFSLMTPNDVRELSAEGVDFQLHTHTHYWPPDREKAIKELSVNQDFIASLTGRTAKHFCYPNGIWTHEQLPYLSEAGIKSATTTDHGINFKDSPPIYCLARIVDDGANPQIRFEAQVTGYIYLMKRLMGCFRSTRAY